MSKAESAGRGSGNDLNVDFMRSLVKQYSELGQWTSAFFWADAAAASSGSDIASGDDIWLLASAMLARGELHRAAHAVTSRELHQRHLLCLGVAMRAYIAAKEPSIALDLLDDCDLNLLEPRTLDHTHNRALAGVMVWQARALAQLERREAAADALISALRADCACYEALDLLLEQHALTPRQENDLVESLPINTQLNAAEAALLRTAYRERLLRYTPLRLSPPDGDSSSRCGAPEAGVASVAGVAGVAGVCGGSVSAVRAVRAVRARSAEAAEARGRRLAAAGAWGEALRALEAAGPWSCAEVRAACLVELARSAELFAFAHALVDAYPHAWTSWYAVGCYYYLIGKSEFARRYLSKAWGLFSGAGCVWLAYGHSFAADNEHDQAMAAYFKASQLMPGCHLPPLYVGVECSLLNNVSMCERFMARAAALHSNGEVSEAEGSEAGLETESGVGGGGGAGGAGGAGWLRIARGVTSAHVAHEAGAAAFAAGDHEAARALWLRALDVAGPPDSLKPCWAATLDALGHAHRALGRPAEALRWHERALALRPARAHSLAARGLCLALLGRERDAADALHAALARDPDHVLALALLDSIVDRLDAALTEEEIPQFAFPALNASVTATPTAPSAPSTPSHHHDATNTSDMSMSFD